MRVEVNELLGKTLTKIEKNNVEDEIIFYAESGEIYKMYHYQDCCENVMIDDINGDLDDLIGSEITLSEEVSNDEFEKEYENDFTGDGWEKENSNGECYPESHTWTFYKFATLKGYVDIRWFGSSNGYYSESVDFVKADEYGNFSPW